LSFWQKAGLKLFKGLFQLGLNIIPSDDLKKKKLGEKLNVFFKQQKQT
jgi:hypothetical protein